jgi:hypothetical protein
MFDTVVKTGYRCDYFTWKITKKSAQSREDCEGVFPPRKKGPSEKLTLTSVARPLVVLTALQLNILLTFLKI